MGGDGLFSGWFATAIQASAAVKVLYKPGSFVNENLLNSSKRLFKVSSGNGSEQHMENEASGKFSCPHAATSSLFNFLFDFLFQATM